jgi:hypothetical protein
MLPGVDYNTFNDEEIFGDNLVDLEYETMSNLSGFIEEVKELLLHDKMIQSPEIMVSYLCAYLGFFVGVGLGKSQAETLEPLINNLIISQSSKIYKHFLTYNILGPKENLQAMRADSPGSIVVQTLRLGRVIWDTMEELSLNRITVKKQTEWFCPQDSFLQLLVKKIDRNIRAWEDSHRTKPVLYAVNQIAMQIAWIMGYFAYMDKKEPTKYIEFGLPLVKLYGEAVERMHRYSGQKR